MLDIFFQNIVSQFQINPLAQVFGYIGLIILLYGFAQKDDRKNIIIVSIAVIFWALHFLLLGVFSAFVACLIGIFRLFLSLRYKKNLKVFSIIILTIIILGIATYQNIISLLPIFASMGSAYSYFFLEKIRMRLFLLLGSGLWLIHNIFVFSIPGIMNEILVEIVMVITIIRLYGFKGKIYYYRTKASDIIHGRRKIDYGRLGVMKDINK